MRCLSRATRIIAASAVTAARASSSPLRSAAQGRLPYVRVAVGDQRQGGVVQDRLPSGSSTAGGVRHQGRGARTALGAVMSFNALQIEATQRLGERRG
ncbi:hypothetical protein ACIQCD_05535 [Streptomyces sp. NPDC093250]|uniref:hypothetical protein n=1 Tax=Streptomyces sp. NPDC093250 TaxID=3366036 RepID=UPI0037FD46E1